MWDVGDMKCLGCGMFGMWDVQDVGYSGYGMFGMWDVWAVGCLGWGMFGMWDIQDVGCSRCGMFGMWDNWDVGCSGCGMWDVDLQNAITKICTEKYISAIFLNQSHRRRFTRIPIKKSSLATILSTKLLQTLVVLRVATFQNL